jgi:hypothetical protein
VSRLQLPHVDRPITPVSNCGNLVNEIHGCLVLVQASEMGSVGTWAAKVVLFISTLVVSFYL